MQERVRLRLVRLRHQGQEVPIVFVANSGFNALTVNQVIRAGRHDIAGTC